MSRSGSRIRNPLSTPARCQSAEQILRLVPHSNLSPHAGFPSVRLWFERAPRPGPEALGPGEIGELGVAAAGPHSGTGFPRLELRIRLYFARDAQQTSSSTVCPRISAHSIHTQQACLAHIRRSTRSCAKLQFVDAAVTFWVCVFVLIH